MGGTSDETLTGNKLIKGMRKMKRKTVDTKVCNAMSVKVMVTSELNVQLSLRSKRKG
jgi:hypothetical protein